MAKIILEPGEECSHRHDEVSFTCLLSSNVDLITDSETISLEPDVWVQIEPGVLHQMKVTGAADAIIKCNHRNETPLLP